MKQQTQTAPPNVLKDLHNGKVHRVYLLCGEEHFLIEATLKQMLEALLQPATRDFNLTMLDGLVASARDIISAVEVYPIMADWRVVIVTEFALFKNQKATVPLQDVVRDAAATAAEGHIGKALALMARAFSVSVQEIAEQRPEYLNAVQALIEELAPEEIEFLNDLPSQALQLGDIQPLTGAANDTDILIGWLEGDLPEQSVLIFMVKGAVDERIRLVKAIARAGRYVSFAPMEVGKSVQQDGLFRSVSRKLESFGKKLTPTAFKSLQNRTGNDMQMISEAIEKLVAFVGDKARIDERDVEILIPQSSFDNIFALTDAIGKRALHQALPALHSVLESGEPPIKINALIARQLRLLLQAKLLATRRELKSDVARMPYQRFVETVFRPLSDECASLLPKSAQLNLLKQNPYAAYKIIGGLAFFDRDELIECLEKTLEADLELKSGQLDPAYILEQLVYEICSPKKSGRLARNRF